MVYSKNLPYNELPILPPNREVIESKEILRKSIKANKALANLKGSARRLPNQGVLTRSIILQEAKFSSEIENIVTTNDELYQATSAEEMEMSPQTKEVFHYHEALWHGFGELKQRPILTTNLFTELVQIIKENKAGIRNTPGTKIANSLGEVIYTPPEGESIIRDKLANLEQFININDDDLDPLIKLAIIHYQFEAIHPFIDGNGRVGRIVNILYLLANDLLELPILYLSKYIIENKNGYYSLLKNVTETGDWESWILYILDAVEKTAIFTQNKVETICHLMDETHLLIKEKAPEMASKKELVEVLFQQPYCKIKFLEEAEIAKRQTASLYLSRLEEVGILTSIKVWREKLYLNMRFYEALKDSPPLQMDDLVQIRLKRVFTND